jgi:hypothetical protein
MTDNRGIRNAIKLVCSVLLGTGFVLSYTSCNHASQYKKQTAVLDSLNRVLKVTDSALKKIDSAKVRNYVNHVIVTMDYVKMLNRDTVSQGASDILKAYGSTRWEMQTFLGRQAVIKAEIAKSIDQITHLNHDMNNDLVKKDSAMIFYSFEVKKATELIEAANFGLNTMKMQVPMYEMITPQADSLVNRLKNHQKI